MRNKFLNRFAKVNNLSIENSKLCIKVEIAEILLDWMRKRGDDSYEANDSAMYLANDFLPSVCDNGVLEIFGEKHRIDVVYKEPAHYDVIL